MSLKTVLKNFLNHFENLENRQKSTTDEPDLYAKEFHSLKELTESLKTETFYCCKHGLKDVNRRKNRYKDILPYDYSRVILSEYPGVPGSDYINANYVRGSTGSSCAYVASQGPLPNTVVDFWRMIWECEVSVIVMACNETESGKYKCESYWPQATDSEQQYGNITAQLIKWRQVCPDFLVRTFKIKCESQERIVCQFHYTTWPDHGVPSSVQPILELVRLMRDVQASEARPILVHCSAGCGRTGTICSIDYVWALLRTGKLRKDFSLYKIIHEMRRQRIAMVQTQEQYILCYRAIAALFQQQLKMIDSHTYENLDEDGEPFHKFEGEEENDDNDDKSNNNNDNESSSIDEYSSSSPPRTMVQRSVSFPCKDMKQLIDNWKIKKDLKTFSSSQSIHSTEHITSDLNGGDIKEKLVGKATVIRRPSIARLKAMFEPDEKDETDFGTNRGKNSDDIDEDNYGYRTGFGNCISTLSLSDGFRQEIPRRYTIIGNVGFTKDDAPPKPPRTYQYVNNRAYDTTCEDESIGNGRLIVSVAHRIHSNGEEKSSPEPYEDIYTNQYVSAPNLHQAKRLYDPNHVINVIKPERPQMIYETVRPEPRESEGIYYTKSRETWLNPMNNRLAMRREPVRMGMQMPVNINYSKMYAMNGRPLPPINRAKDDLRVFPRHNEANYGPHQTVKRGIVQEENNQNTNDKKSKNKDKKIKNNKSENKTSVNQEKPKQSGFASFFGFRKKSKTKISSPNQPTNAINNQGNTTIRPPHSHRFSPPTQWTQV